MEQSRGEGVGEEGCSHRQEETATGWRSRCGHQAGRCRLDGASVQSTSH